MVNNIDSTNSINDQNFKEKENGAPISKINLNNKEEYNYNPKDEFLNYDNTSHNSNRNSVGSSSKNHKRYKSENSSIHDDFRINPINNNPSIKPYYAKNIPTIKSENSSKKNSKKNLKSIDDFNNKKSPTTYDTEMPMKNDIYNEMIFELEKNFSKEKCENQLDIIYTHTNKGKFTTEMIPRILNSIHPNIRFKVFKILLDNIFDWPQDENYFNSVICFLPKDKHNEAKEIIKAHHKAACCCIIF